MSDQSRNADAIQAQINVSVAQARLHIASWLPPEPEPELDDGAKEPPLGEKSDESMLKPSRLGLGAPVPPGFLEQNTGKGYSATNDALRRRLIGRKHLPAESAALKATLAASSAMTDPESSGDEDGRSSVGKTKRKLSHAGPQGAGGIGLSKPPSGESRSPVKTTRFGTYFDAHRVHKRKRNEHKSKPATYS